MNTQADLTQQNDIDTLPVDPSWRVAELDNSPSYEFREAFRKVVLIFFNATNRRNGAYVQAELQAKYWFKEHFGIDINAWHYRNRREPLIEVS